MCLQKGRFSNGTISRKYLRPMTKSPHKCGVVKSILKSDWKNLIKKEAK